MALPIPYQVQPNTIYAWDANTLTATMKACGMRVHTVVTSPPYFGLRDYGADGQIGLEPTPDEYVRALVTVFRGVRDILRDDGTLWLNLGDSYANDDKWGGATGGKHAGGLHGNTNVGRGRKSTGLPPKSRMMIPARVALALQEDGWILRDEIIWHKPAPMPEPVQDRTVKAHEMIYMFSKSLRYYYDYTAIAEPALNAGEIVVLGEKSFSKGQAAGAGVEPTGNGKADTYTVKDTRNKRSVWTVNTEPSPIPHFAMYPQKLIEPCILAGCPQTVCTVCGAPYVRVLEDRDTQGYKPPAGGNKAIASQIKREAGGVGRLDGGRRAGDGSTFNNNPRKRPPRPQTVGFEPTCNCNAETSAGIVFDPFMGGGTTALVAQRLGRQYIGSEINPENVEIARYRVSGRIDEYLAKKRGEAFTAYMFEEQTA